MSDKILPKPDLQRGCICTDKCPAFYLDRMPGWPPFDTCLLWEEKKDGKEPYYMAGHATCKPYQRLHKDD